LGGIATGMEQGSFCGILWSAACVLFVCAFGLRGRLKSQECVTVELRHGGNTKKLVALCDTGNSLIDPVTGQQVLVVGADVAWEMLGYTESQLQDPVETLEKVDSPGLRLVPYRSVGQSRGMLLAIQMESVIINGKKAGRLVALAPEIIGKGEGYQALTGGMNHG